MFRAGNWFAAIRELTRRCSSLYKYLRYPLLPPSHSGTTNQISHNGGMFRHVGSAHADFHDRVLRGRAAVCERMRAVEVGAMTTATAILLIVSICLLAYLLYSLLFPEKF